MSPRTLIETCLLVLRRQGLLLLAISAIAGLPEGYRLWRMEQLGAALAVDPSLGRTSDLAALTGLGVLTYAIATLIGMRVVLPIFAGPQVNVRVRLSSVLIFIIHMMATVVGLIFVLVPGFFIWLHLYIAEPISMAEGVGVGEALRRSSERMKGKKGVVFIALIVLSIPSFVLGVVGKIQPIPALPTYLFSTVFNCVPLILPAVVYSRLRSSDAAVQPESGD